MADLDTLRMLAGKALPGPWRYSPWHIEEGPSCVRKDGYGIVATVASDDQAAYIAACDPQTILALLDENERLRRLLVNILNAHKSYIEANPAAAENPDWLDDACELARAELGPHP